MLGIQLHKTTITGTAVMKHLVSRQVLSQCFKAPSGVYSFVCLTGHNLLV